MASPGCFLAMTYVWLLNDIQIVARRLSDLMFVIAIHGLLPSAIQFSPARRWSAFTLATAMLVFAGRTWDIPQILAPGRVPATSFVVGFNALQQRCGSDCFCPFPLLGLVCLYENRGSVQNPREAEGCVHFLSGFLLVTDGRMFCRKIHTWSLARRVLLLLTASSSAVFACDCGTQADDCPRLSVLRPCRGGSGSGRIGCSSSSVWNTSS